MPSGGFQKSSSSYEETQTQIIQSLSPGSAISWGPSMIAVRQAGRTYSCLSSFPGVQLKPNNRIKNHAPKQLDPNRQSPTHHMSGCPKRHHDSDNHRTRKKRKGTMLYGLEAATDKVDRACSREPGSSQRRLQTQMLCNTSLLRFRLPQTQAVGGVFVQGKPLSSAVLEPQFQHPCSTTPTVMFKVWYF